ncbi:MAG: pyridoxal phosphate-dependent aminotransferase [Gammaproteobacteria bacterium]|nr:pyridoxal phosphate-dependent aminotransferase [Gammaproteobacteria bacterium]MBL7003960.1 pyridoxal phosphate-dependent aminotransferase [Gammaproteobacteria bacterium]
MKLSSAAQSITTSPILTIAAEINQKINQGEQVFNLTVGDFNSQIFPIPERLTELTIAAYEDHQTNYPGAFGLDSLRQSIVDLLKDYCDIDVALNEVQVACGSRPLIYSLFKTIVDPGEKVVYPVPSWNNDYYTELHNAEAVIVETSPETNFFPTADSLRPHLKDAVLLSLCSPQNPTGTILEKQQLQEICDLVVEENKRRSADDKPLYVMFDQVYWLLTFGNSSFYHPLSICPEIKAYAVFIDGISKSFAGTGVRVGWATGPEAIISKMRAFIAHIGAWAPKPEQVATAQFLAEKDSVKSFLDTFLGQLQSRLDGFYQGFMQLKGKGYDVDAIAPQAAIYLSVRLGLKNRKTPSGEILSSDEAVHQYLLNQVGIGVLPFSWFGADTHADWYRISVGTCSEPQVKQVLKTLELALEKLS